jgi:hypothetical protein
VRHAHASLTPSGLATLQRRLGNRGMGALIQRLTVPTQEPEVGAMVAPAPPQGPGIVLGTGTKKLLDAVGRLGSRVAGPPSSSKSTRISTRRPGQRGPGPVSARP